ncbi:MAG: TolC family outer membrane protein [Parvibaculum sp.]
MTQSEPTKQEKYKSRGVRVSRLLGSAGLTVLMMATPGHAENLMDALASAYQSNPELLAARAGQRATDEQVPQALAGWRPSLNATGSWGSVTTDSSLNVPVAGLGGKQTSDPMTGTLQLTQNVFTGGRTLYGARQAEASVMAGRENLRNVEQSTLLDAVTGYMNVMRDLAVVDLRQKNVQVLQRQLEASQDRFSVGEITRTDVAQSEARLSLSQTNLIRAEAALIASRSNYERVIGRAPGTLEPVPPLPALPQSEAEALQLSNSSNPALEAARHAERAAGNGVAAAKGGLLPTVSFDASIQHAEEPSSTTRRSTTTSLLGRVNIPLYQSGAQYSAIREAKHRESQSRLQRNATLREVEEGVRNAWEQLRSARAAIGSNREQVKANEIALDGVRQEAQVGSRTTLDVLDAEQELLDSQVSLVGAERDEYVAGYALLSATGQLGARELGLPVNYYDPVENYEDVKHQWVGWGTNDE